METTQTVVHTTTLMMSETMVVMSYARRCGDLHFQVIDQVLWDIHVHHVSSARVGDTLQLASKPQRCNSDVDQRSSVVWHACRWVACC